MTSFEDGWKTIDSLVEDYKLAKDDNSREQVNARFWLWLNELKPVASFHKMKYTRDYLRRTRLNNNLRLYEEAEGKHGIYQ